MPTPPQSSRTPAILTQSGDTARVDLPSSSSFTGPSATMCSSSRHSTYSSAVEDEACVLEFDESGKIQVDDELHLIGEGDSYGVFTRINIRAVILLLSNFGFFLLATTWLLARDFRLDFLSTALIALTVWTLILNVTMTVRMLRRMRAESQLAARADDYRDYARKVATSTVTQATILSDANTGERYFSVGSDGPVFV